MAEKTNLQPENKRALRRWQWGIVAVGAILTCALIAAPFLLREYTNYRYGKLHYGLEDAPDDYRVAVVFGARVLSNDRLSTVLRDRVAAAVDLYRTGKVDVIIMSGDGRTDSYNEPRAMASYAISRGVPADAIVTDEGGLRTYDTCYRLRDVYQVRRATLVTQESHLDRALFLCNGLGIDAVGVAADYQRPNGYTPATVRSQQFREFLATTVAFVDLLRRQEPTILGEPRPVTVPIAQN